MRQVVLDTETTGLDPSHGHRLIEIGCIEIMNRRITSRQFHTYLNPQRKVDEGAFAVHGISDHFLADKPTFIEVVDEFLDFVQGAELIIHNAAFDMGFINHELHLLAHEKYQRLEKICSIFDTLAFARSKHRGQRNSLDALCKRYAVDNQHRTLHGALLDAEILADVYLAMTGGQDNLLFATEVRDAATPVIIQPASVDSIERAPLKIHYATTEELSFHEQRLKNINAGISW